MKTFFVCGAALALSACTVVPTTGEGNYDGVAIDGRDPQRCISAAGEIITAPVGSTREQLVRCAPQSQPLAGS